MAWYWWSGILFIIGACEHAVAEYENLVSVRLKIPQTVVLGEINEFLAGIVYIITLKLFWNGIEGGHFAVETLVPFFCYIQGKVFGSAMALIHYKSRKRKTEHEKRMQHLEKANRIKKQLKDLKDEIVTEVETEFEFDESQEQESKDASKETHHQTDNKREAPKKEDSDKTSPPTA